MVVNYNDNGELTMGGTSLKTIAQSFGTPSIVYKDIRIDEFTFKGVGANSEQLSAMNHDSLMKEYL